MGRAEWKRGLAAAVGTAAVYMLLDVPVQLTGFLRYGSFVGVKNFLPGTLGLLLGPWGAAGCAAGCAAGALLLGTAIPEAALECACAVVTGLGMWLGWYALSGRDRVRLKGPADYLRYGGLTLALAALCGALSVAFLPGGAFVRVLAAYTASGLLVGTPVLILAGSVFWVRPVLPPWRRETHDLEGRISSGEDIGRFNDWLEEVLFPGRGLERKKLFEIQNVVEEVSLRVLAALPRTEMTVQADWDGTASLRFSYGGGRYDPLRVGRDEDELALIGLRLIRHRALRASHVFRDGENRVHIVV